MFNERLTDQTQTSGLFIPVSFFIHTFVHKSGQPFMKMRFKFQLLKVQLLISAKQGAMSP